MPASVAAVPSAATEADGDDVSHCSDPSPLLATPAPTPFLVLLVSLSLKLLLTPARYSTDLDVHRHWKALTHSLPLSDWYVNTSSIWTLDYPPLFAYFEYLLSLLASLFAPSLLTLHSPPPLSPSAELFMRLSVLLPEPLLLLSAVRLSAALAPALPVAAPAALVLLAPGLALVDNLHFQYNLLPLSFLLLALSELRHPRPLSAALLFVAALNLKHTLLPLAPAFAVTLLTTLHIQSPSLPALLRACLLVALPALTLHALLWLPFYLTGGRALLAAILARLFPFSRGLLHAYWAPNLWALYALVDKLLLRLGLPSRPVDIDPSSGHIGARAPFAVLPNPSPAFCASLLLALLVPALIRLAVRPKRVVLVVVYSATAAFLVGWHVHEKAILVPLLPLAILAAASDHPAFREAFLWLSVAGQFALFPLIDSALESIFKIAHFVAYHAFAVGILLSDKWRPRYNVLAAYAVGAVLLELYGGVGGAHRKLFGDRMQFMPLMMISVYSAVGVLIAFAMLTMLTVLETDDPK